MKFYQVPKKKSDKKNKTFYKCILHSFNTFLVLKLEFHIGDPFFNVTVKMF